MNPVRADHERCLQQLTGFKPDFHMVIGLANANAAPGEMDRPRLQAFNRFDEHPMQIAAVQQGVRRTVTKRRTCAEIVPCPGFARAPMPNLLPQRAGLYVAQHLFKAESNQFASAVRANLDAGTYYLQPA